ncbi:ABC transporter permease subunit [Ruficoccus amylovorans]|uniref:ABC transporter permease subunit n=1 Tax=Ruficoccus amylovorans TaxID=1804625 RepID=A0A842HGN3_9BACT|nr:ABC transporter permease [Ruficoccus amylovorans]MBC2595469.1 ABC transporter permease subunit [Ruficoccus amylovorans]
MKFKILKALDIAGLQVFDPLVRLIYRENPREQCRKILLYIGIPVLTFGVFLGLWSYLAPRHTTKAGQVPTPSVVEHAAGDIWSFHRRENRKANDFLLSGEARQEALVQVKARLAELEPQAEAAGARVDELEAQNRAQIEKQTAPLETHYRELRQQVRDAEKQREAALIAEADALPADDIEARQLFLKKLADAQALSEAEKEELRAFKDKIDQAYATKFPTLQAARRAYNQQEQELQFLRKRLDYLTDDNQSVKVAGEEAELTTLQSAYYHAQGGEAIFRSAEQVLRKQQSIDRISQSAYSRPWTFPRQIARSLACVFLGFFIATIIAIPLGVICGLSRVCMAALTPLIALFKPVSPIVWLPIVFIIVGGFISDPEKSFVHPAFLSSAITVALCSLWPTLVNTALGVASVDKDHINVARVLRLGFASRLFRIVLPSALPLIFAGLRISLGVGWMVLIAAELLSSSEGIGKFVWDMFNNGSSQTFAQMFVVVFVVGVVGLLLDRIMIVFQRLVSFDEAPSAL